LYARRWSLKTTLKNQNMLTGSSHHSGMTEEQAVSSVASAVIGVITSGQEAV
jgi:hypothetical protein